MDHMNENPGLDLATVGDTESAHTDTADNSVAGSAATDFPAPNEVNLLAKWFFIRKVASDRARRELAIGLLQLGHLVHGVSDRFGHIPLPPRRHPPEPSPTIRPRRAGAMRIAA